MRILVLGDSYCPSSSMRDAFGSAEGHQVDFADVVDEPAWQPTSLSETRVREYLGSPAQVIAALQDHEVLVVQGAPVTDAVLDAAPSLRLVCVVRGGPVNVDLEAASARGIPVVTTPGKNANAVAELTVALVVMLGRRVPELMAHVAANGELYVDNYEGAAWYGTELAGRTLGLVGFGQVGRRVARLALACGMRVLAVDPFVPAEAMREAGVEPVASLDDLLPHVDVLSLHARATAESRGLIDAARLAAMRRGAFLVNTARDVLVDEDALDAALASGQLGGAALDLASPSPAGHRHRLLAHANVVLLPHVGGATLETLDRGGRMAVEEITRLKRGESLVNVANRAGLAAAAGPMGTAADPGAAAPQR